MGEIQKMNAIIQSCTDSLPTGTKSALAQSFVFSFGFNVWRLDSLSMGIKGGALGLVAAGVDSVIQPLFFSKIPQGTTPTEKAIRFTFRVFVVLSIVGIGASLVGIPLKVSTLVCLGALKLCMYSLFALADSYYKLPEFAVCIRDALVGSDDKDQAMPYIAPVIFV